MGGFGGALPDLDAISLWSKFDSTFGELLGLSHSGSQIYFGKFWYSHHGAFHSLLTPFVVVVVTFAIVCAIFKLRTLNLIRHNLAEHYLKYVAFYFGFTFHLFEDMSTPGSVWGGVNLFFPCSSYIGGLGEIWWWNNYDLVLIIVSVIVINSVFNLIRNKFFSLRIKLSSATFVVGIVLALYQINTRPIDFSYSGHTPKYNQYEYQSKQIQRDILGERLYHIMVEIDNKIPLYF